MNYQLTSASLKGAEDLTGELFRSTLALSLERGGVLLRTYLSAPETSNAREASSLTDLGFAQRRGGFIS